MARWEYLVEPNNGPMIEGELDVHGAEGWELVAVTATDGRTIYYFKRPIAEREPSLDMEAAR
jgi:hypothetical protein